ncbi:MAG: histidinol dehydrogenase [Sphingomicrobium sp.]
MKRLVWNEMDAGGRSAALARPRSRTDDRLRSDVRSIIDDVAANGWAALCDIARRIDGAVPREIAVRPLALAARRRLARDQIEAIEYAAARIRAFAEASVPADFAMETAPGLVVRKTWRPIERVGLYIPGGKTPLFSSLMMLAIPARAAGVDEIVTVTPPRTDGSVDDIVALAAELSGVETIWTVGGAQAIAALALGAGGIAQVDKICGPGNAWVAEAKRLVSAMPGGPAIDLPAGPSELMVIADAGADPRLVAADLLSQAEHDAHAQVMLVTWSAKLADAVANQVEQRICSLPRRAIAEESWKQARIIIVGNLQDALAVANLYAPEHLSLAMEAADEVVAGIRHAGAVFAGPLAAEAFGDYLAGPSHVLPTDGAAKASGGVSVYTFLKAMTVQSVTPQAARRIAGPAAVLARMEGLEAHALAADARLELVP